MSSEIVWLNQRERKLMRVIRIMISFSSICNWSVAKGVIGPYFSEAQRTLSNRWAFSIFRRRWQHE